ncbi:MAG TPA: hypothetical protein VNO70_21300 [Blastocatellia bacterium]|nr:hypothetical protein [Blastocatellia bacterium]
MSKKKHKINLCMIASLSFHGTAGRASAVPGRSAFDSTITGAAAFAGAVFLQQVGGKSCVVFAARN